MEMKLQRACRLCCALFFMLGLSLCLSAQPLLFAVEEATPKETITEEVPPGETEGFTDRLMFIVDFDAFVTRSDLNDSPTTDGFNLDLLFAPVYQFNERTFFILMYDGHYYKKREFYSDDIGNKERTEFQSHTIQPMVRFDFGEWDQYSLTPSVFHTATYNKDLDTAGWSDGLYNYRDYGAGLDFDWRGLFGDPGTLSLTGQYYTREYPNYASLLSLTGLDTASGLRTEKNEKDYDAMLGKAGYTWIQPLGLSWEAGYELLYKMLEDKKIVQSDGTLGADEPDESVHFLNVNLWYTFDIGGGLKTGVDLDGAMNDSEQNYYDGLDTVSLADDVFTADYYDYDLYRIRPNVSYTMATVPFTTTLSYAYQKLEYDERRVKNATGTAYGSEKHWERQRELNLRLQYYLTDNWSIIGLWQNLTQRSNNEDERTYRYEYTLNNYSLGVAYKY
jgi:hypothetical protein